MKYCSIVSDKCKYTFSLSSYTNTFKRELSRINKSRPSPCVPQVWCVGSGGDNQTRYYINRTVDGDTLSTALRGLVPGVLYQLEVAAVTSAGVGARSQPLSVLISESTTPTAAGITVSYLNNYRRDCHDILYTLSISPEDES